MSLILTETFSRHVCVDKGGRLSISYRSPFSKFACSCRSTSGCGECRSAEIPPLQADRPRALHLEGARVQLLPCAITGEPFGTVRNWLGSYDCLIPRLLSLATTKFSILLLPCVQHLTRNCSLPAIPRYEYVLYLLYQVEVNFRFGIGAWQTYTALPTLRQDMSAESFDLVNKKIG